MACFGCGWKGDIFDFLLKIKPGSTLEQAVAIVKGELPDGFVLPEKATTVRRVANPWKQATPDRWPKTILHDRYGPPVAYWPYTDANGVIVSYDCRFEYPDETTGEVKKDVLPLTFAHNGERGEWRWQAMDIKRHLYNLHTLLAEPTRTVLLVEGRKTAEGAEHLCSKLKPIVSTWQGGSNAIDQADWSSLYGHPVIIWQDNDFPGYQATLKIVDHIKEHCPAIKFIHNHPDKEKGWDAYDAYKEGWSDQESKKFILGFQDEPQIIINPKEQKDERPQEDISLQPQQLGSEAGGLHNNSPQEPEHQNVQIPSYDFDTQADTPIKVPPNTKTLQQAYNFDGAEYFRFLGFESKDGKITHCFYNLTNKSIIKLTAGAIGKGSNLLDLAPLHFWEYKFPKTGAGFDIAAAANFLISTSNTLRMFRAANIRGRGVWMDNGTSVVHNGDDLIVNGEHIDLGSLNTSFIYEQNVSLGLEATNPLNSIEASKFLDLCNNLKWDRDINGYLLAGWCIIAPVCGALSWRPHIWITGGAGSGKTWVLLNFIRQMLGEIGVFVQGSTSEAGIRQYLRRDARPVVFDEADTEDQKGADRMQNVLTLMRAASAEDGGNIVKGSSSSGADTYQIRSCFAFASIGIQLSQQSDRTRVTILSLQSSGVTPAQQQERQLHFKKLEEVRFNLMTADYIQKLQARTISLLPTIIANAKTFASAAAQVLGTQRSGDQLGALLAGAYSLRSTSLISIEDARAWVIDKDWSEEIALTETRDEHSVFSHIMEYVVRVEGISTSWDRTIGELIKISLGIESKDEQNGVSEYSATQKLSRTGIKLDIKEGRRYILISNTDTGIKRMLEKTPWKANHANILLRIPGAEKRDSIKFGSGVSSRCIAIPIEYFT